MTPWPKEPVAAPFNFKLFMHQHGFVPDMLNNLVQTNDNYQISIHPQGSNLTTIKVINKKSAVVYSGLMPRDSNQAHALFSLLKII
jgi:uncharacterized protein YaaR (DUF327 family)